MSSPPTSRPSRRRSPADARNRSYTLSTTLVCCFVFLTLIGAPAVGVVGTTADRADTVGTDLETAIGLEGASLEDLERNGTVELVVRLEEATVPAAADGVETDVLLEEHADDTQEELLEYVETTPGVDVRQEFWLANAVVLEVDVGHDDLETAVLLEDIGDTDDVVAVHPNFEVRIPELRSLDTEADPDSDADADGDATDPDYTTTYGPAMIGAPDVWRAYDTRGAGVRVVVLDTGIDTTHPDLELYTDDPTDPTYPGGWASFEGDGTRVSDSTPRDTGTHGTAVSSLLAGGNASGAYLGVAPDVDLLHGQVLTEENGTFAQLLGGMEWALESDADVVSMSLGAPGYESALIEPVRHLEAHGIVVVAAIGNDGEDASSSPANVYDALAVGANDADGQIPSFSGGTLVETDEVWTDPPDHWPSTYVTPDVVAPGVATESAIPDGEYRRMSGTSMATPHVAGAIALSHAVSVDETPDRLTDAVLETTWNPDGVDPGPDTRYGHGIVDAKAAADTVASARLEGTITDDSGTPISGATVTVDGDTATTDSNGTYSLSIAPGDVTVSVEATDYHTDDVTITIGAGVVHTHDVTLERILEVSSTDDTSAPNSASGSDGSPGFGALTGIGVLVFALTVAIFTRRLGAR